MRKRRRTARQWYQYHLGRSKRDAQERVERNFAPVLDKAEAELRVEQTRLSSARQGQPFLSRVLGFFGIDTDYQTQVITPLKRNVQECQTRLYGISERLGVEVERASERGASDYESARAFRKQERIAQAERVAERAAQRRIRYLEQSPSIRSAARFLKTLLITREAREGSYVSCFYCGVQVNAGSSHLEHKRPVSRGGTNRLSNLTLVCPKCNLSKGSKTDSEFVRSRNGVA